MMEKDIYKTLSTAANTLGITLGAKELSQFKTYYNELLKWNEKINLVSVKSELDIPIKHFIDSLTLLPLIKNKTGLLLDIGAGAGFPGIPLKIVLNSLKVSLLESSRKKSSFLKHIIRSLKLTDIFVINSRAEGLMEDAAFRDYFDIVTSRATFKLPEFFQMGAFFLSEGGTLIAMKGKKADEELTQANRMSQNLGFKYILSQEITLPLTGDFRKVIIFEKSSL
ncbi:MAG TPA: 16S rRNA (guanine(527)-N(7))-methyltransferase RsmG [Syntrophales bacterium]|nr:16S rRNA (guanine(527)-N(7))-methyltransferase RsmG [Syntrophales bacterium]